MWIFKFESLNPGGHSSVPSPDNAIYHLAARCPAAIVFILGEYQRNHAELFRTERGADDRAGLQRHESRGKQPLDPAAVQRLSRCPITIRFLHTTCVATMLSAVMRQTRSRKPRALTSIAGFFQGRPSEVSEGA